MEALFDIFPYALENGNIHTGLIARDYIAIHAMKGLIANPAFLKPAISK